MSQAAPVDRSVLIVEDQSIIASDLRERLTELGYDVCAIADNSDDAVQYAQKLRPSLIFMGIVLRGTEDGIQAAQRIQTCMDIPIVFLTADADTSTIERAMCASPDGFLIKPFDARDLRITAEIAISRHPSARRARNRETTPEDIHLGVPTDGIENCRPFSGDIEAYLSFRAQLHSALEAAPTRVEAASAGLRVVGAWLGATSAAAFDLCAGTTPIATWGRAPSPARPEDLRPDREPVVVRAEGLELVLRLPRMEMAMVWWAPGGEDRKERQTRLLGLATDELWRALEHWWVEGRLREAEQRRALLYQHALHAVISTDADGRVTEYNAAAATLLGLNEHSVGSPVLEHMGLDIGLAELCAQTHHQRPARLPNGQEGVLEIAVVEMAPLRTGTPVWTFFINDTTAQHHAQAAIEAARNDKRKADQDRLEFMCFFAHEIRTPVNAMVGMAEIARNSSSPADVLECVERIQVNSVVLTALLDDAVDFSRINAGPLKLEECSFDLWSLVDEAAHRWADRAYRRGLSIHTLVDPDVPRDLVGAYRELRTVLEKLLSNAIRFTDYGSVQLTAALSTEATPRLLIAVKDTGIGISAADQERLFSRFFRVAPPRFPVGLGLGLYISRSLVQEMGGEITVQSECGVGSTFRVFLPLRRDPNYMADPVQQTEQEIWVHSADPVERGELLRHIAAAGYRALLWEKEPPSSNLPELIVADCEAEATVRSLRRAGAKVVGITREGSEATGEGFDELLYRPVGPRRILDALILLTPLLPPAGRARPTLGVANNPDSLTDRGVDPTPMVLVVAKDVDTSERIKRSLEKGKRFRVLTAADAKAAHDLMLRNHFDLAFLDVDRRGLGGKDLLAQLRKAFPTTMPRVTAMVWRATPELRQAWLSEGFDEVLSTTVASRTVRRTALRLLEKAGWTVGASDLIRGDRWFMAAH